MGGGDEVDVVTAQVLQVDHDPGQVTVGDLHPVALVADVPVLAEAAAQVAVGEEDGAGAMRPHKRGFLPEVRRIAGHLCQPSGLAGAQLVLVAVHMAFPRAKVAIR